MTWNYRVFKARHGGEDIYTVREAYYRKDGSVSAWSALPDAPCGETKKELVENLRMMLRDCLKRRPTLRISDGKPLKNNRKKTTKKPLQKSQGNINY